ncbi:transporter associated domain protein [[Clostridium] sordellii ATCC 9714]|nr:transporter associated domain protein [[Clostridium] sordellii ATCC 9714] [Paeniclostridium sordellii ATCC 9714]
MVKGYLSVNDFNDRFDLDIEEGDYDTLNGYLTESLGKIPEENEIVELEKVKFTAIKVKNRRVEEIQVNLLKIEDKI